MKERFCLLLILFLITLSLMAISLAVASIPIPAVPEFTVEFIDHSYDIPTTYYIDPYTGENITHLGYHVPLVALEVAIGNQPFVPYYDEESEWNITFHYNIRMKGFYSEDWVELYRPSDGYPHQSDTDYTVISLGNLGGTGLSLKTSAKMIDVPSGGQVDFQVEAMIGYVHRSYNPNATDQLSMFPWVFTGETSGWSNTQTITIPASIPSPSPTQSPSPTLTLEPSIPPTIDTVPCREPFPTLPVLAFVSSVALVTVGLVICFKKLRGETKPS